VCSVRILQLKANNKREGLLLLSSIVRALALISLALGFTAGVLWSSDELSSALFFSSSPIVDNAVAFFLLSRVLP
jgi:hypothetical protein